MKLLNLNKEFFFLIILSIFFTPLFSEDSIDIWKKENLTKKNNVTKAKDVPIENSDSKININSNLSEEIQVNTDILGINKDLIYGIFDPDKNNLTIDMWIN